MAEVILPILLAKEFGGIRRVKSPGRSVAEVIQEIDRLHPGFQEKVCNGERLRPIFRVVIDGQIALKGYARRVGEQSRVEFLPAFGGG